MAMSRPGAHWGLMMLCNTKNGDFIWTMMINYLMGFSGTPMFKQVQVCEILDPLNQRREWCMLAHCDQQDAYQQIT